MPIELNWDDTIPNVVHYRFMKGWTWEEFRVTALKEHQWGEALNGIRYDIIGDLTQATFPQGTPFANVFRLFRQGPENRKMIVVAGSAFVSAIVSVGVKVHPPARERFHATTNLDEARKLILTLRDEAAGT